MGGLNCSTYSAGDRVGVLGSSFAVAVCLSCRRVRHGFVAVSADVVCCWVGESGVSVLGRV